TASVICAAASRSSPAADCRSCERGLHGEVDDSRTIGVNRTPRRLGREWRHLGGPGDLKMGILSVVAGGGTARGRGAGAARAQPPGARPTPPAVTCVSHPACTITVSDSVGFIPLPYLVAPNTAFLQSRTFSGAPGTPAAGRAGYMYRISLTQAAGSGDCLGGL